MARNVMADTVKSPSCDTPVLEAYHSTNIVAIEQSYTYKTNGTLNTEAQGNSIVELPTYDEFYRKFAKAMAVERVILLSA